MYLLSIGHCANSSFQHNCETKYLSQFGTYHYISNTHSYRHKSSGFCDIGMPLIFFQI